MIHERECSHCGVLAQWRSIDPVPAKCTSCGAPPKRSARMLADAGDPTIRLDILYGFTVLRPVCGALHT